MNFGGGAQGPAGTLTLVFSLLLGTELFRLGQVHRGVDECQVAESLRKVAQRETHAMGIGLSVMPIRFACPPKLTLFALRPERP